MSRKKSFWHKSKAVNVIALSILVYFFGNLIWDVSRSYTLQTYTPEPEVVVAQEELPAPITDEQREDEIFRLVNEERTKRGIKPLERFAPLDRSAQRKANDMVAENYYGHVDKNGFSGVNYIFEETDICSFGSENLVRLLTPEKAVEAWMGSKSHKEAILDERYVYSGIGLNSNHVVQHFCEL